MKSLPFLTHSLPPKPFKPPLGPIWEFLQRLKSSSLTAIKHGRKVKMQPVSWALGSVRGIWQTAQLLLKGNNRRDEGRGVDQPDREFQMATHGAY